LNFYKVNVAHFFKISLYSEHVYHEFMSFKNHYTRILANLPKIHYFIRYLKQCYSSHVYVVYSIRTTARSVPLRQDLSHLIKVTRMCIIVHVRKNTLTCLQSTLIVCLCNEVIIVCSHAPWFEKKFKSRICLVRSSFVLGNEMFKMIFLTMIEKTAILMCSACLGAFHYFQLMGGRLQRHIFKYEKKHLQTSLGWTNNPLLTYCYNKMFVWVSLHFCIS